jgi:excisionase family DNA binding protein
VSAHAEHPLTAGEVLRAPDVARLLHVPLSTVHEWARKGLLPSRKRGKHRLFIRGEVEQWLLDADS